MLEECFENVAPYIENLSKIKKFVRDNSHKSRDEVIRIIEEEISRTQGTLRTDYVILLNELRRERR